METEGKTDDKREREKVSLPTHQEEKEEREPTWTLSNNSLNVSVCMFYHPVLDSQWLLVSLTSVSPDLFSRRMLFYPIRKECAFPLPFFGKDILLLSYSVTCFVRILFLSLDNEV